VAPEPEDNMFQVITQTNEKNPNTNENQSNKAEEKQLGKWHATVFPYV
jgi:hypothetical protein